MFFSYAQKCQGDIFGILKIRLSKKAPVKLQPLGWSRALSADFYDFLTESFKYNRSRN
jgi:hypothetical protein